MRIGFTDHAIDRYIQHHTDIDDQNLTADQRREIRREIRELLDGHAPNAVKLKEKTILGDTQWRIEALGILCVTKPDNGEHVCVTILPNRAPREWMTPHEAELLEERATRLAKEAQEVEAKKIAMDQQAEEIRLTSETPLWAKTAKLQAVQQHASTLKKQLALLTWEQRIVLAELKTVRHGITHDEALKDTKDALRAALRFISSLGPQGEAVLQEVARYGSGFVTPEFYNCNTRQERNLLADTEDSATDKGKTDAS